MITDNWNIWQQGMCGTYAVALIGKYATLRLGVLVDNDGVPRHFAAHDDSFAYDSAGCHPLPYCGIDGSLRWIPDVGSPEDWGLPDDEGSGADELREALAHAHRYGLHPKE